MWLNMLLRDVCLMSTLNIQCVNFIILYFEGLQDIRSIRCVVKEETLKCVGHS